MNPLLRWLGVLVVSTLAPCCASAVTLYSTEFEEFTAGPDQWAGTNGWLGNSTGVGVHGIDQDILPGLGKTAFLGFNRPKSLIVSVFRPALYDPASNGMPVVEFETLMGIQDSTNGYRDSFFFTFYNSTGDLLAAIRFDNSTLTYGIWRLDGASQSDTGIDFVRAELHLLYASINFTNNTWSADLDGIPLFTAAPFNATTQALNLGFVAAEWQLTSTSTNQHGDNWMLVADWAVRVLPAADTPFWIDETGRTESGYPYVKWMGTLGFDYLVEYSDSMQAWQSNLLHNAYSNVLTTTPLTFTDENPAVRRIYRIQRSFAP